MLNNYKSNSNVKEVYYFIIDRKLLSIIDKKVIPFIYIFTNTEG